MQKSRSVLPQLLVDGRVRAVVLRAAAVPVAVASAARSRSSRRATACRSRSPRRPSSASRPTSAWPACRSARCVKKELDPATEPHARDARARAQVRAAARRREGDPAPEVAARRDLRRADAGLVERRRSPRAAGWPTGRCRRPSSSTRSSSRSTRRRAARSALAAGPRQGHRRPRAGPQRRDRHAARLRPRRRPTSSQVLDAQQGAFTRLVKNTGVTFGALTENEQQLHNLITLGRRLPGHARAAGRPRRDVPDLPDVPRRVEGDVRQAPADVLDEHASRWSTT